MGLFLVKGSNNEIESSIVLQTRRGRSLDNAQYWELLPNKLEAAEQVAIACLKQAQHPIERRRNATGVYNCHGMTFACRRTGIYELPDINHIIADDGYREISRGDVKPGDVILYHERTIISHSGIVVRIESVGNTLNPMILSKWGNAGEYIHHYKVCPYIGDRESFHREAQDGA